MNKSHGPATSARQAPTPSRLLDGPLLTPAQVAGLLSVRTSWVYEAVRVGNLPCLRLGRHIRFTRAMVEEWLAAR